MTICERMFDLLEKRGLSAYGLCQALGVTTSTTTTWKQRGTDPQAKHIWRICEYLDCSVEYLLTGKETKKAPVPEISENGWEMLQLFNQLPDREQILLIGRLQEMVSPMLTADKKGQGSHGEQAV